MRTVTPAVSSFEEAREKVRDMLSIIMDVVGRLSPYERVAIEGNLLTAAQEIDGAQTSQELQVVVCNVIHHCSIDLRVCKDHSQVGRVFVRWLSNAERQLAKYENRSARAWLTFLHKRPRLWKASLLSLLGMFDMAVGVGEAIERAIVLEKQQHFSDKEMRRRILYLLRCWKRVEEVIDTDRISKLGALLRRVRKERELRYSGEDTGAVERALGLEEFLLKTMIEMAAWKTQDGMRLAAGIREFTLLRQMIEEYIVIVGAEAAEASAMNLVLESVRAEERYLLLRRTWGAKKLAQGSEELVQRSREYHEAHCAVIDAYMELSDCKSLRGVMLCYELPIFTQLLYDQRKRLDEELKAINGVVRTSTIGSEHTQGMCV